MCCAHGRGKKHMNSLEPGKCPRMIRHNSSKLTIHEVMCMVLWMVRFPLPWRQERAVIILRRSYCVEVCAFPFIVYRISSLDQLLGIFD
jgi:hypothetical protein